MNQHHTTPVIKGFQQPPPLDQSYDSYNGGAAQSPTMYYSRPGVYHQYGPPYTPRGYMEAQEEEHAHDPKMIYEQNQRYLGRIQFLEEEIVRKKETIDTLHLQLNKYEQEKQQEKKKQSRYWTPEEHTRFIEALTKFGHKDVKAISTYVGSRNPTQVRTHAQKYFLRIDRERQRKMQSKDGDRSEGEEDSWNDAEDDSPQQQNGFGSPTSINIPNNPFGNTPNCSSPGGASSPHIAKRKRETVMITASHAKSAPQYRDIIVSMIQGLSIDEYDSFTRGLIAHIDIDDTQTLFKTIKESFLKSTSMEIIEATYNALLRQCKKGQLSYSQGGDNSSPDESPTLNYPQLPIPHQMHQQQLHLQQQQQQGSTSPTSSSQSSSGGSKSPKKKLAMNVSVPRGDSSPCLMGPGSSAPSPGSAPSLSPSSQVYMQQQGGYPMGMLPSPNMRYMYRPIDMMYPPNPPTPQMPHMTSPGHFYAMHPDHNIGSHNNTPLQDDSHIAPPHSSGSPWGSMPYLAVDSTPSPPGWMLSTTINNFNNTSISSPQHSVGVTGD